MPPSDRKVKAGPTHGAAGNHRAAALVGTVRRGAGPSGMKAGPCQGSAGTHGVVALTGGGAAKAC